MTVDRRADRGKGLKVRIPEVTFGSGSPAPSSGSASSRSPSPRTPLPVPRPAVPQSDSHRLIFTPRASSRRSRRGSASEQSTPKWNPLEDEQFTGYGGLKVVTMKKVKGKAFLSSKAKAKAILIPYPTPLCLQCCYSVETMLKQCKTVYALPYGLLCWR